MRFQLDLERSVALLVSDSLRQGVPYSRVRCVQVCTCDGSGVAAGVGERVRDVVLVRLCVPGWVLVYL